jgi:hypothetical protein
MQAHATQVAARNYIELQILRAQLLGARSGVSHAMALFQMNHFSLDPWRRRAPGHANFDVNSERRLKIGITCYPSIGGSGILASALGEELARRGHEVHFISYERPFRMARG